MQSPREAIATGLQQVRDSYRSKPGGDPNYTWAFETGGDDGWWAYRVVIERADPVPSERFPGRARAVVSVWVGYAVSLDMVDRQGPRGGPVSAPSGPNQPVPKNPPNARTDLRESLRNQLIESYGGFAPHVWEDGSLTFLVAMPDEEPWVH